MDCLLHLLIEARPAAEGKRLENEESPSNGGLRRSSRGITIGLNDANRISIRPIPRRAAHQFKCARRALKFVRTRLGRVIRDITRKIEGDAELAARFTPFPAGFTIRSMRPCATGLRRNATSLWPGRTMSDTKLPRPCRCR